MQMAHSERLQDEKMMVATTHKVNNTKETSSELFISVRAFSYSKFCKKAHFNMRAPSNPRAGRKFIAESHKEQTAQKKRSSELKTIDKGKNSAERRMPKIGPDAAIIASFL